MKIETLPIGLYGENSYVLHDEGHVLFIDPGRFAKELAAHVKEGETVDAILLTHGHEDHTQAVDDLYEIFHCPVYLHEGDFEMVDPKSGKSSYAVPLYSPLTPLNEGEITIGAFPLTIYHTPGHSKGSVLIRYRNRIFAGDTLFAGSIGRTDLFGGDDQEMIASLKRIREFPDDLWVYPGHGDATTIGQEKQTNPYLVYLRMDLF
ncbi:MAG: MBL fold metallo-hydrolase [Solobacterium sp.]|nr:MBL fold metallo-hydrolase [Solobacterium sp.]